MQHSLLGFFYFMNNVSIFRDDFFGELKVYVVNGEPYFPASRIAAILGYSNPRKAIRDHVEEEDKIIVQMSDFQEGNPEFPSNMIGSKILIMNESGLYSLILSSKLKSAKKFKKWVTSEILPSIRKTGSYSILPKDYSAALRALADEVDAKNKAIAERNQIEIEKQQAIKTIEEQKSDVEFSKSFKAPGENDYLIRDVAKRLEQNGIIVADKNLRLYLEETKFMFRNGRGEWELYSNVVKKGYGTYRPYFKDEYSGDKVYRQTIYMTGSGYEVTLKAILGKFRKVFEKYGRIVD